MDIDAFATHVYFTISPLSKFHALGHTSHSILPLSAVTRRVGYCAYTVDERYNVMPWFSMNGQLNWLLFPAINDAES